jgi:hypothetical protein
MEMKNQAEARKGPSNKKQSFLFFHLLFSYFTSVIPLIFWGNLKHPYWMYGNKIFGGIILIFSKSSRISISLSEGSNSKRLFLATYTVWIF